MRPRQPRSGRVRQYALAVLLAGATCPVVAATPVPDDLRDLYFGEALFHSLQGEDFTAISRLDAELALHYGLDQPELDSLRYHTAAAELYVGDLELSYRMNRRGGRAMTRLLAPDVPRAIRHKAALRLGRLAFEKGEYDKALEVLEQADASGDDDVAREAGLLRGQVLLALDRPAEAADVLAQVDVDDAVAGYTPYNRAIALLRSDQHEAGLELLDRVGRMDADSADMAALRDKANLALGFTLLKDERPDDAREPLQRVRIDGPFSNKALLWYGWGDAAKGRYRAALSPWMELRERDATDPAVQEALLAAPYAFAQLEKYGRAAVLYGKAVDTYGGQIDRLDEAIRAIRDGRFLAELIERDPEPAADGSGAFRIGDLPDDAPTRYLADLMAGRMFQQAWLNYRDLSDLLERINRWQRALPGFHDLLDLRRAYYEPRLPPIESRYTALDQRLGIIRKRLEDARAEEQRLLRKRDPMALATGTERDLLQRIDALRERLPDDAPASMRHRLNRLSGVLRWRIDTGYADRLSAFHRHIEDLDTVLTRAEASRFSLLKRKEAVPLLYQGHDRRLEQFRQRLEYLESRIDGARDQQARFIEQIAIEQLNARKARLKRYQTKARFAAAENFDRATTKRIESPGSEEAVPPAGEAGDS